MIYPGPGERRSLPRFHLDEPWSVILVEEAACPGLEAAVWDMTIQGAGLVGQRPYAPGTRLTVRGRARRPASAHQLGAVVRHSRPLPDGQWLIGCQFSRLLTVEDLDAMT